MLNIGFEKSISLFRWLGFSVLGISIDEHSSEDSLHPGTGVLLRPLEIKQKLPFSGTGRKGVNQAHVWGKTIEVSSRGGTGARGGL